VIRNYPIWDVLILGLGFLFRVVSGAFALNLQPTYWLLFCTYSFALLIGFGKRYGEWKNVSVHGEQNLGDTRRALKGYSPKLLRSIIVGCSIVTGLVYVGYCFTRDNAMLFLLTSFPVLFGLFIYNKMMDHSQQVESPESLIFNKPSLLLSVLIWIILITTVICIR